MNLDEETQSHVSIYKPVGDSNCHAVIYYHGGGLLFGERTDLLPHQKNPFLKEGFTLACVDYPLAPEAKVPEILDTLYKETKNLINYLSAQGVSSYSLFGRSAGAYLALMIGSWLQSDPEVTAPKSIIDFYGYHSFNLPGMLEKNEHYAKQAKISAESIERLVGELRYSAPTQLRYALYVYARQTGTWDKLLGVDTAEAQAEYALSQHDIELLPPLFITAGTDDKDVPFTASKELRKYAPSVTWIPQYYKVHLFDDAPTKENRELFQQISNWLLDKIK